MTFEIDIPEGLSEVPREVIFNYLKESLDSLEKTLKSIPNATPEENSVIEEKETELIDVSADFGDL